MLGLGFRILVSGLWGLTPFEIRPGVRKLARFSEGERAKQA